MENQETAESGVAVVVEHSGRLSRCYNVAAELSEYAIANIRMPARADSYDMSQIGELGRSLVTSINDTVPGVEEVYLRRYALTVAINVTFEWETVEPGILAAIEAAVGPIEVRKPADADAFIGVIIAPCCPSCCTCDEPDEMFDDVPDDLS